MSTDVFYSFNFTVYSMFVDFNKSSFKEEKENKYVFYLVHVIHLSICHSFSLLQMYNKMEGKYCNLENCIAFMIIITIIQDLIYLYLL